MKNTSLTFVVVLFSFGIFPIGVFASTDTFYADTSGGTGNRRSDVSPYAAAHDASSMSQAGYGVTPVGCENEGYSGNYQIMRSFLPFDTSAIPDENIIDSATLYIYVTGVTRSGDGSSCTIVQSSQASTTAIADSDWGLLGTTSGGSKLLSSMPGTGYESIDLDPTALGWVNKTGFTKLGLRDSGDISNTPPASGVIQAIVLAEGATETNPPKLVVTHHTPTPIPVSITGSGSSNMLAKFTGATSVGNSLFSDDGSNITLTAGNLLMQLGSLIDTVSNGVLNFGTSEATTMTFGRTGQKVVINSSVGIGTNAPMALLHVNGDISGTSIKYGSLSTASNCVSATSPAVCGSAPAGSVAMNTGTDTLVVNTSAVTANSQIMITEDSSLGERLGGIICNTGTNRTYKISSRSNTASFTIKSNNKPVTNKACLSYLIVN